MAKEKNMVWADKDVNIWNMKDSIRRLSKFAVLVHRKGEMNEKWKNVK